ncbi:MAG: hypothetical protein QXG00_03435 [Candidatus Woesearchaeota archaeon]
MLEDSKFGYLMKRAVLPFAVITLTQVAALTLFYKKTIPEINKVQQGYIAPSKLEIKCKDLDGNGEPETIMKIGDKPYLLREVDGKPVLSPYEIKPAEIQYKE